VRTNNRLKEFRKHAERLYDDMLKEQGVVSAELLKNKITGQAVIPTHLLQMGERERERLAVRSKEIDSTSTYRSSRYYQSYIREFLDSKGKTDIAFSDITEEFGREYKVYIKRYKNFGASQTNHCLCWLNRLMYLAIDHEIIRANPLEELEYEKKLPSKRMHISKAELKQLLELKLPAYVTLFGKGRKKRVVPLQKRLVSIMRLYLAEHKLDLPGREKRHLFYNNRGAKLSNSGIAHIITLYANDVRVKHPGLLPDKISPHSFRHSKAMHLLQAGVNLVYIRDILGHASIKTTEIYARAYSKQKRDALEKAYANITPERTERGEWETKPHIKNWLKQFTRK